VAAALLVGLASVPASAATWLYRSLDLPAAPVQTAESEPPEFKPVGTGGLALATVAQAPIRPGALTRLRFGRNPSFVRVVLDFTRRTRFIANPIGDRTIEISLLDVPAEAVGAALAPPAGFVSDYDITPDSAGGTKLVLHSQVPVTLSAMGDLAPERGTEAYRLFFDLVPKGTQLAQPSFVQGAVDFASETGPLPQGEAVSAQAPQAVRPPAAPMQTAEVAEDGSDPRNEGLYLRLAGGFGWSLDPRDDLSSGSDVGGNYKASVAVGNRFGRILRAELEAGHYDGFETKNLAGTGDIEGWYSAVNLFANVLPPLGPVQPYLGAGLGISYNEVHTINGGTAPAAPGDKAFDLLWSAFAGAEVEAYDNFSLDVGYRFVHYGDARSDKAPNNVSYNGLLRAHEFYLGFIYDF